MVFIVWIINSEEHMITVWKFVSIFVETIKYLNEESLNFLE
jgi:hypothetical protein